MSKCNQCCKEKFVIYRGICQSCYSYNHRRERQARAPKIPCACGCGEMIFSINLKNKPQKFKDNSHRLRENHNRWKGGRYISRGYWVVLRPEHPNSDSKGYVRENILIMSQFLGRPLKKTEIIHHINKDKLDNRIENLELLQSPKEHRNKHRIDMTGRKCILCGAETTYVNPKTGNADWGRYENGFICSRCRFKLWSSKRRKVNNI